MSEYRPSPFNRSGPIAGAPGEVVRKQVLRNTYWLLALSLIPTVLARRSACTPASTESWAPAPGCRPLFSWSVPSA